MRVFAAVIAAVGMIAIDCVYAHPHWVPLAAWVVFAAIVLRALPGGNDR